MLTVLAWSTGGVLLAFMVAALGTSVELARGRRVVLPRTRSWIDRQIGQLEHRVTVRYRYVTRYVITLSWYYGLHACLKTVLRFLAYLYGKIEDMFIRNRAYAKAIRKEHRSRHTHLTAIAEHKAATTLTPEAEAALKERSLKGR